MNWVKRWLNWVNLGVVKLGKTGVVKLGEPWVVKLGEAWVVKLGGFRGELTRWTIFRCL